ncbi:hypothetical protein K435DRAFT_814244 [Dendrothele bispora CBS 962.96]|uniref:Ubiquitin-like protease family profile domain-containing protein n=1 Tax=Dendrothele bispora (strain CBS 962.96) TaxID=1314807 RepID=A0A4V4HAH4_DENBC|nr:hypothetical protein K435DRAFT_814244 [Dendrothele bispora CBS 962.96]
MGWLNQLRHNLRYGAQSLLAVLDSDSENETDLDTTCVQIPSYHGVLNNLTPLPTRSHTTEEENQVADQLMSDPNSPKEPGQGVKEVPFHELHDHVPVYQQRKIVSYRDISPQWEQHKTQQVPVTNQDGKIIHYRECSPTIGEVANMTEIPVMNKDASINIHMSSLVERFKYLSRVQHDFLSMENLWNSKVNEFMQNMDSGTTFLLKHIKLEKNDFQDIRAGQLTSRIIDAYFEIYERIWKDHSLEVLMVPIFFKDHWIVAIADFKSSKIRVYDTSPEDHIHTSRPWEGSPYSNIFRACRWMNFMLIMSVP